MTGVKLVFDSAALIAQGLMTIMRKLLRFSLVIIVACAFSAATVSVPMIFNFMTRFVETVADFANFPGRKPITIRQRWQREAAEAQVDNIMLRAGNTHLERELAAGKVDNIMLQAGNTHLEREIAAANADNALLHAGRASMADEVLELGRRNEALIAEVASSNRRVAILSDDLAQMAPAQMVLYRGQRRLANEVVSDTTRRLSRRTVIATSRNVASMPGESIPVWGISIVAAATAWELNDACEMMKDVHEMDVAFNPDHAIDTREVCGMQVPTVAELWTTVRQSPGAIWATMQTFYGDLPDVDWSGQFARMINWLSGFKTPWSNIEIGEAQ